MNRYLIHISPSTDCCKIASYRRKIDIRQLSTELLQQQLINLTYNRALNEAQKNKTRKKINKELSDRLFSGV